MITNMSPLRLPASALPVLGILLFATTGHAATALRLDLPALVAAADLVVRGTVSSASCRMADDGRIVTDSVVHIDETLNGNPDDDAVVVSTLGGEVGNRGQHVSGSPVLRAGDEVVLFLQRSVPATSRTSVVGLAQGAFHVVRSQARPFLVRRLDGMVLTGTDAVPIPEDLDVLRESIRTLVRAGVPR